MTKVQQSPTGNYSTTIPKRLAKFLKLKKGDPLQWHVLINEKTLTLKRAKK